MLNHPKRSKQATCVRPDCAGFVWSAATDFGVGIGDRWDAVVNFGSCQSDHSKGFSASSSSWQRSQASAAMVQASALKLSQEIMPLRTVVQQLVAKNTKMIPGSFRRFGYQRLPGLECSLDLCRCQHD